MGRTAALSVWFVASLCGCSVVFDFDASGPEVVANGNCRDGLDNDGDGVRDLDDPGCWEDEAEAALCADGVDNDGDGFPDAEDVGCWPFAAIEVERCASVDGVVFEPDFGAAEWTGTSAFVATEEGWTLGGSACDRVMLHERTLTGALTSLDVSLVLRAHASPADGVIFAIYRARDVVDARVPLNEACGADATVVELASSGGRLFFRGSDVGGRATTLRDSTYRVHVTNVDGPALELVDLETEERFVHQLGGQVGWAANEALRLVVAVPDGFAIRDMKVHTDSYAPCDDAGPVFEPRFSRPVALTVGATESCAIVGDSQSTTSNAATLFAGSADGGTTWETYGEPDPIFACYGLLWDLEAAVFRAACIEGGRFAMATSASCAGPWRRTSQPLFDVLALSKSLGMTRDPRGLYEIWGFDHAGEHLVRIASQDPEFPGERGEDDPRVTQALVDGLPAVSPTMFSGHHTLVRRGRDRLVLVSDGVALHLYALTGLAEDAVDGVDTSVLRPIAEPLIAPSGIVGAFDARNLGAATMAFASPSEGTVAELEVLYAGSAHCAGDVCGVFSGRARVRVRGR